MFTPIPPVRSLLKLLAQDARLPACWTWPGWPSCRSAGSGQENFTGDGGPLLLTGNAMHADVPADAAGSGVFGWLLAMLGQDVGFPVPQGGAQNLAFALQRRFESLGGQVRTGARVTSVLVAGGRAVGVRTRRRHRDQGRPRPSSPTSPRRFCIAIWLGCSIFRPSSRTAWTDSSGTIPP